MSLLRMDMKESELAKNCGGRDQPDIPENTGKSFRGHGRRTGNGG